MMNFNSLLFNILEKCDVRCRHCGYTNSWRRGAMDPADLVDWVTQAVDYGVRQITFSGGEVFLDFELLRQGVEAVHRAGGWSGVFTNCRWAGTEQHARRMLRQLPGLTYLHLSCDPYHLEWVPVDHVRNVVRAARALSIPHTIICVTYAKEADKSQTEKLFHDQTDYVEFHHLPVIPSPDVERLVPAVEACKRSFEPSGYGPTCFLHTPLVHTTGNLWTCHIGGVETHWDFRSSPYFLGNLHEVPIDRIFARAEENAVYQFLRVGGPGAVAEAAAESPAGEQLSGRRFSGDCDMCYQLLPMEAVRERFTQKASAQSARNAVFLRRVLELGDRI